MDIAACFLRHSQRTRPEHEYQYSVTRCEIGYGWCTDVRLVRGVGRKTVRVIIRPAHGGGYDDEDRVAIDAAKIAAKNGWRKIVVTPDDYEGNTIRGFNLHQYHFEQWQCGRIGEFLGFYK